MKRKKVKTEKRSWFSFIKGWFRKIVRSLLTLRYALVLLFILMLTGSIWYAGNHMKFILFPSNMAKQFYVFVELPTGTPLQATSDKVKEIESLIMALPDEELASFNTRIGTNVMINAESENYAALSVTLTPYTERTRSAEEIVESIRSFTNELNGFENIGFMIQTGGPPVGKPVSLMVVGADDKMRSTLADSVESFLSGIEGVKDISRDDKHGKDQVEIKIDYRKLSRLGLTVADVAQNVRIAYDGEVVTSVRYGDEDVDFRVFIQKSARRRLSYLNELLIPNNQGRLIPLKEVARLLAGPGQADYRHFDGERTITIEADIDQGKTTPLEVNNAVFNNFDLDRNWPGMQLGVGGELFETEASMTGLFKTLIIAVIAIFFLLVLLFNSFTQPFLVMSAIPFGIIGVIAAFAFHGEPFSFMGIMGIIGLSGVVVNDSLVLVNHLNKLKEKKPDLKIKDIIAEGTADRLRAIVLTTITTVAALLPLAYGLGGVAIFMAPMALALGWGLVFATPLTLVLVPCLYMIGHDFSRIFVWRKNRVQK